MVDITNRPMRPYRSTQEAGPPPDFPSTYLDDRRDLVTVGEYAELWLSTRNVRQSTEATYSAHLRRQILPLLGDLPLGAVTPTTIRLFTRTLSERLAPSTVLTTHNIVACIFRHAVDDGYLVRSPCRRTSPGRPAVRPMALLTPKQTLALAQAMTPRLCALVPVCAGLGLRQGEALGLTVDRVRPDQREVHIDRQIQTLLDGSRALVPPKTAMSVRVVPLPSFLEGVLARHVERFRPGPWGLIFSMDDGSPWGRSSFGGQLRAAVKRAHLPRGTRLQDLRHTYVSTLIRAGVHPKVIQARLGHASISVTMDLYGHLFVEDEAVTRDAIDNALAGVFAEPLTGPWAPH